MSYLKFLKNKYKVAYIYGTPKGENHEFGSAPVHTCSSFPVSLIDE